MLIDLSEVLSEPHKSIDEVVGTEMKEVKVNGSRFTGKPDTACAYSCRVCRRKKTSYQL
mgnify:FL=1